MFNRRMIAVFLLGTCLLAGWNGRAETGESKSYPVHKLGQAPAVDGKLDDAAWRGVPEARGLLVLGREDLAMEKPTAFKMGWLDGKLYLAAKCAETSPEKMSAHEYNQDGLWSDDCIEFFVVPKPGGAYRQFIVNSLGSRWLGMEDDTKASAASAPAWGAKASVGKDGWTMETAIPFEVLGLGSGLPGKCQFNLCRDVTTGADKEKNTCWAALKGGSFNEKAAFATLDFQASPPPADLATLERRLNGGYDRQTLQTLREIASGKGQYAVLKKDFSYSPNLPELDKFAKGIPAGLSDPAQADALYRQWLAVAKKVATPVRRVVVAVQARDAAATLYVNGKETPVGDGGAMVDMAEGLTVLAVKCVATGKTPGVKISVGGAPETEGRWKVGPATSGWAAAKFDDRRWASPNIAPDGFFWSYTPADKEICARQAILWSGAHDGKYSRIQPNVKQWGFSENSVEGIHFALSSPFPHPLEDFEVILDAPENFTLLDMANKNPYVWCAAGKVTTAPRQVVMEKTSRDGARYNRFIIKFDKDDVVNKVGYTILPLKLGSWSGADKTTALYFRAQAAGNYTELETRLPVEILPPVNGRMPKRFMLTQYVGSVVFHGANVSYEHMRELVKQAVAAGFNDWDVFAYGGEYNWKLRELALANGARVMAVNGAGYPIWGNNSTGGGTKNKLYGLMANNPDFRARYFNGTSSWEAKGMYCPSKVTAEGREQFVEAVRQDFRDNDLRNVPEAGMVWLNWESWPWESGRPAFWAPATRGDNAYCFCDRCKREFKKRINMPEGQALSDGEIFKRHYVEWEDFRYSLDGKIQGLVREALAKEGRKYMVYSNTCQYKFWKACKGNLDYAMPGCPGNPQADGRQQKLLDDTMDFFRRETGLRRISGQRFPYFSSGYKVRDPGNVFPGAKFDTLTDDGHLHPKTWKSQTLRMAASLHGGIDFQTVIECNAGMLYYIGEATRPIAEFEDLFVDGQRQDQLAESKEIAYPNLLVLTNKDERLVLLFNEGDKPLEVELSNKDLKAGQTAAIYGVPDEIADPSRMKLTVPPEDVALVHIK